MNKLISIMKWILSTVIFYLIELWCLIFFIMIGIALLPVALVDWAYEEKTKGRYK